jgi:glycogen operon protein
VPGSEVKDISWIRLDGREKTEKDWHAPNACCLSFVLSGEAGKYHLTSAGRAEPDDNFFVVMNASDDSIRFKLPSLGALGDWETLIDTSLKDMGRQVKVGKPGDEHEIAAHSFLLFVSRAGDQCPEDCEE